jgi:tryptophan synthase beta chain
MTTQQPIPTKIYLTEAEMPTSRYNIKAVMKEQHDPFLHPGTLQPCTPADLYPVFCKELVQQEFNTTDKEIPIPE